MSGAKPAFMHISSVMLRKEVCFTGEYDADPDKDFTVIATLQNGGYNVIAVSANSPYQTLQDLVDAAKANPGTIIWGAKTGSTSHFFPVLLENSADVKFNIVDAGSESEKLIALLGGNIDVSNFSISNADQNVKAGKMRVLAVIGPTRDMTYTDYPCTAELGYPDVVWNGNFTLWGPAGMDPALVDAINSAFVGYEKDPEATEALKAQGSWYKYMNAADSQAYMLKADQQAKKLCEDLGFSK